MSNQVHNEEGVIPVECEFRTGRGKVIENAHDHQGGVPMTAVYTVTLRGNFGNHKKDDLIIDLYREQPQFTKQSDAWEFKALDVYTDTNGCCVEISLRRVRFLCSTFKAEGTRFIIRVTARNSNLDAQSDGFVTRARNPHSGNGNRRPSGTRRSTSSKSHKENNYNNNNHYNDGKNIDTSTDDDTDNGNEKEERYKGFMCTSINLDNNKNRSSKHSRGVTNAVLECLQDEPLDIDKLKSLLRNLDIDELNIMSSVINEFLQQNPQSPVHSQLSPIMASQQQRAYAPIPSPSSSTNHHPQHHPHHHHHHHPEFVSNSPTQQPDHPQPVLSTPMHHDFPSNGPPIHYHHHPHSHHPISPQPETQTFYQQEHYPPHQHQHQHPIPNTNLNEDETHSRQPPFFNVMGQEPTPTTAAPPHSHPYHQEPTPWFEQYGDPQVYDDGNTRFATHHHHHHAAPGNIQPNPFYRR